MSDQILNPRTGKMVKRDGKIGQKLLQRKSRPTVGANESDELYPIRNRIEPFLVYSKNYQFVTLPINTIIYRGRKCMPPNCIFDPDSLPPAVFFASQEVASEYAKDKGASSDYLDAYITKRKLKMIDVNNISNLHNIRKNLKSQHDKHIFDMYFREFVVVNEGKAVHFLTDKSEMPVDSVMCGRPLPSYDYNVCTEAFTSTENKINHVYLAREFLMLLCQQIPKCDGWIHFGLLTRSGSQYPFHQEIGVCDPQGMLEHMTFT